MTCRHKSTWTVAFSGVFVQNGIPLEPQTPITGTAFEMKKGKVQLGPSEVFLLHMVLNLNSSLCKSSSHARQSLCSENKITKWKSHWAAKISLHEDKNWTCVSVISQLCPTPMSCVVFGNPYFLLFTYPSFLLAFLQIWSTILAILISKCQRNI